MTVIGKLVPNAYQIEDDEYLDCIDTETFEILGEIVFHPEHTKPNNTARTNNYLVKISEHHPMAIAAIGLHWGTSVISQKLATFNSFIDVDLQDYINHARDRQDYSRVHLWLVADAIEVVSGFPNKYHSKKLDLM